MSEGNTPINIHANNEDAFRLSCENGHTETAKWLWGLSMSEGNTPINIHANDEDAFRLSCENGHTETAKWLWGLSMSDGNTPINIHAYNEYAFRWSCENGHTETAKWLWGLSMSEGNTPINIHADNEDAFRLSCENGHTETAKWLWGLSMSDGNTPINIHADNEDAFRLSCENGHTETAKWLCEINPKYSITIDETGKIKYEIENFATRLRKIIEQNKLDELYKNSEIMTEKDYVCPICLTSGEEVKYCIQLNCNIHHTCCVNCFVDTYSNNTKCHFRCNTKIDLDSVKLIQNSN